MSFSPKNVSLPVFGLRHFLFQGCHLLGFIPSHEETNLLFSLLFSLSSHAHDMTRISAIPPHSPAQLNKTNRSQSLAMKHANKGSAIHFQHDN